MFTLDDLHDMELKTANYGICKLSLMIAFLEFLPPTSPHDDAPPRTDAEIDFANKKFISWLEEQIGRQMSTQELIRLYEGILAFIRSDEATPERLASMRTLFELEFLDKPDIQNNQP